MQIAEDWYPEGRDLNLTPLRSKPLCASNPPLSHAQHSEDRYPEGSLHRQPVDSERVLRARFAFHPEYRQKKTNLWKRLKPKLLAEDPKIVVE